MAKKKKTSKAVVHEDLKGFNISINSFGEMESSMSIDKLNTFLNKVNTNDQKMKGLSSKSEEE